jgi:hypothetical protein
MVSQGRAFVTHVLPAVIKPLRTLWNEVIGFLFIVIAIPFFFKGYQLINRFDGSIGAVLSVGMCGFMTILMMGYGISSFRKARKISRS